MPQLSRVLSRIVRRGPVPFVVPFLLALPACSETTQPTRGDSDAAAVCTTCGDCEEDRPVASANHLLGPIDYPDPPPAGGDHNPCWTTWGVHTDVAPVERWVHNLEHGGVVYLYRDAGTGDETVAELAALVKELPRTVLTEYAELPKAYGVVAWGHRLVSDCMDEKAARDFYAKHFNHGPEDIPSDPSCN
jgi:hypothetical protein